MRSGQASDVLDSLGMCPGDQGWSDRLANVTGTEVTRHGRHNRISAGTLQEKVSYRFSLWTPFTD